MPFFDAFGVREDPFGVTPDPRFLYLGLSHREALASLMHGIEAHRGFMALIAPPGMGKTTLLFRLLEHLRASADTIFHFQTQCTARELLRYLLADLGSEPTTDDAVALHQQFNQELLRRNVLGRPVVVVLDEAQNLNDEVLEAIRLLSDFETTRAKLMQIVLSGQEQLLTRLASARQRQLRQRVSVIARLRPLGPEATAQFIEHRMRVAGLTADVPFTPEALEAIARHTQGIPRIINNYCFHALSIAFGLGRARIDAEIVEEVAHDFELTCELPPEEPDSLTRELLGVPLQPAVALAGGNPSAPAAAPAREASSLDIAPADAPAAAPALASVTQPAAAAPGGKASETADAPLAAPAPGSRSNMTRRATALRAGAVVVLVGILVLGWRSLQSGVEAGVPAARTSVDQLAPAANPTSEVTQVQDAAIPREREATPAEPGAAQVPAVVGRASVGKSAGENIVRVPKIVPRATATARVDNDAVELPTPQPIAWQSLAPPPAEVGEAAALPQEVVAQRSADIIAQAILPRPAPSLVLRNSQGATSPKLLRQILPDYPAHIRAQGVVGDVVLKVRITERGLVDDISVVAGNPALARAAVAAVGKWEFEPATLDGQPLSVETTVTFRFKR